MERNQLKGAGKQIKGSIREGVGRITGNKSEEYKGKGERMVGKAQSSFGRVKEDVQESVSREKDRAQRDVSDEL